MIGVPLRIRLAAFELRRSPAQHEDYRPDIDGLRAIAVIAVVAYHAVPDLMPGGFVGVDVFFVISGFLISSIIFRALAKGHFSWAVFYQRRANRIFPALILVLMTVWVLAWSFLLWDEYQALGRHIVAGAGFAANLLLYSEFNSYFGRQAATTPLLHLWSLGVEEQFYVIWPFVLISIWKLSTGRARLVAIMGIAALSFALNVATLHTDQAASFYLPWNRIWELSIGSAFAYVTLGGTWRVPRAEKGRRLRLRMRSQHIAGAAGVVLIFAALCVLNGTAAFPGWWAWIPVIGALFSISAGPHSWFNRYVLASPPMVFVGLISYPLYLWHWPLLSMAHIVAGETQAMIFGAVGVAFVLATLTYKYVELPVRAAPRKGRTAILFCIALAGCGVLGYAAMNGNIGARSEAYDLDRFIDASREDWLTGTQQDWVLYPEGFLRLGEGSSTVLFVGDSNMQQYYPRIAKLLSEHPHNSRAATFAVRAGCAPAMVQLLAKTRATSACSSFLQQAYEYARSSQVDTIVIGALWAIYDPKKMGRSMTKPNADTAFADLQRLLADMVARGKRVYVVLNIPTGSQFDPRQMIRRGMLANPFSIQTSSPLRVEIEGSIAATTSKLIQAAAAAGAVVVDPFDFLCDATVCPAVTPDGKPIYRDRSHLRPSYVREHVHFLDATVLDPDTAREGEP